MTPDIKAVMERHVIPGRFYCDHGADSGEGCDARLLANALAALLDAAKVFADALTAAEDDAEALAEALREMGQHASDCDWSRHGGTDDPEFMAFVEQWDKAGQPCQCDIGAVLAAHDERKKP